MDETASFCLGCLPWLYADATGVRWTVRQRVFRGAALHSGAKRLYEYPNIHDYHRSRGGLPWMHGADAVVLPRVWPPAWHSACMRLRCDWLCAVCRGAVAGRLLSWRCVCGTCLWLWLDDSGLHFNCTLVSRKARAGAWTVRSGDGTCHSCVFTHHDGADRAYFAGRVFFVSGGREYARRRSGIWAGARKSVLLRQNTLWREAWRACAAGSCKPWHPAVTASLDRAIFVHVLSRRNCLAGLHAYDDSVHHRWLPHGGRCAERVAVWSCADAW